MSRAFSSLTVLAALTLSSCLSVASYQLPLHGLQARSTFPRLSACAQVRKLKFVEGAEQLNVQFDDNTWIQYMIQDNQYNMVVIVDGSVSDDERPARSLMAKTTGDELFACSVQNSPLATPASPGAAALPTASSETQCQSATTPTCNGDGECQSQNCTGGVCQNRTVGSQCGAQDSHCDSLNCTQSCCQARTPGSLCGSQDAHCDSLNCSDGRCHPRSIGSVCGGQDAHCDSLNCTQGRCQGRTTGWKCGQSDSHCDSVRCVNGFCQ